MFCDGWVFMCTSRYDGDSFVDDLKRSTSSRQKRGKPPRLNRYYHYCVWAHALLRKKVGSPEAEYGFPSSILAYIRHLVPGDIKGEIREHAYTASVKEFCEAMELPEP
ncbi:uncharacterized protein LOC116301327 [Actinia tenebrosa]|uniref:Uncharacterized protein LOC116301327 n=1 Tax=Actinia tenebrosa TaxID=6105 RepID=A0A6P8IHA8_ACTTE|nr:uncharacterized protein LOC116301327 [Actinia tenebrosa]